MHNNLDLEMVLDLSASSDSLTVSTETEDPSGNTPSTEVIQKDAFDRLLFADLIQQYQALYMLKDPKSDEESSDYQLLQDLFASAYKLQPQVNEDSKGSLPRQLMDTMMATQEYRTMVESTRLNAVASALATVQLAPDMLAEMKRQEEAKEKGEPSQPSERFRRTMRSACADAQAEADAWGEVEQFLSGEDGTARGPGSQANNLELMLLKERLELAKKLVKEKKFQKILEIFGRFKNIAIGAIQHNPTHGNDEIVDVVCGNDLSNVLASEYSLLKQDRLLFLKKFADATLLEYDLKGEEIKGRGPLVVCVDDSGSMSGDREIWAKGIVFAMALLAKKQRRSFGVIYFDSRITLRQFWTKDEPISVADRLKILSQHSGGGTDFNAPLLAALQIQSKEDELRNADIVFITDGEARCKTDVINKKKKNVRIHGIGIGAKLHSIRDCLDTEIVLKDLKSIDVVKGIFDGIVTD